VLLGQVHRNCLRRVRAPVPRQNSVRR
jgi:hypothetical protein